MRQLQENCLVIRDDFVYWKKRRISAAGHPKQTVGLFMQDLMQKKAV